MFLSFNLFRFLDISSPALENNLSDGTNVAGTLRYFFAKCCKLVYMVAPLDFHHSIAFSFLSRFFILMYWFTSTVASAAGVSVDAVSATQ